MRQNLVVTLLALVSAAGTGALTGCANRPAPAPPSAGRPSADPQSDGHPSVAPAIRPGRPGAKALAFTGTTREGRPFRLADHRGKTLLVNFFSPG